MLKKIFRILLKTIVSLLVILIILALVYTAPSIWRNIYVYPKLEKERTALQLKYKKPAKYIKQTDYKGVLHAHSYRSHDSRGVLEEIIPAAKKAKLDFIFLSDHARSQLDSFPRGYHGVYDNVIIESGTEKNGLMVNPMKATILNWDQPRDSVIKQVVQQGGLVLYVHTEEKHPWDNADYQAMEIYNIHTDFIEEENEGSTTSLITNFIINGKKYRHWALREIFDEQKVILARWDSINAFKKVVGMAAVDAHNNQNIRARYTKDGLVEWIGPNADLLATVKPGWKEKLLLSKQNEVGWAFKFEVDTYFTSFNYVNTHVFSDSFSNTNIKDNLVKGHAFIAFESLADAKGFQYFTTDKDDRVNAILGDSIASNSAKKIRAVSPLPVQFKLVKDGEVIDTKNEAYNYEFDLKNIPGNYRVEAFLILKGKQVPWIYTNPIYIYPTNHK